MIKMNKTLKKLMNDLWENINIFHLQLKLLGILSWPDCSAPSGQHVRELYTESVSNTVSDEDHYRTCFQLVGKFSQKDLLKKLQAMLEVIDKMTNKPDQVAVIEERLAVLIENVKKVTFVQLNTSPTANISKGEIRSRAQFKEHLEKMSQSKPMTDYELVRQQVISYFKDELFKKYLVPITSFPLHEVVLLDNLSSIKQHIIGTPRAALHTALNNPHHYLQCDCCKLSTGGEIRATLPDVCIAYKLLLECGTHVNMYDWLQSFESCAAEQTNNQKNREAEIRARFAQAVEELQFLGFIKSSKKKRDHVARLTSDSAQI